MQERVGLQAATDGEFRRTSWHMDFIYRLGGIEQDRRAHRGADAQRGGRHRVHLGRASRCATRVRLDEPIFADDFVFLQSTVTTALPKLTIPSPSMVHYRGGTRGGGPVGLPGHRRVLGGPLGRLRRRGARARRPRLPLPAARRHRAWPTSTTPPSGPRWPPAARTPTTSTCATSRRSTRRSRAGPPDMRVTTHMCRGNYRSSWAAEGGYDFVAEALFGELDVDGFFCEFDDERSGGFAPLRFVPPGKQVVLGLVTTKPGSWRTPTRSSAASTRRRSTCRSTSCASRRSAASPRRSRATR